ncbi:MAG TPA: ribose-phosphate pyrophosphokinase [Candidatus Binataceae bacterium]|nr:ribose-phosphate pyrophosphokinase [Candidatus Binataceae bacterium]
MNLMVVAGSGNPALAEAIAERLGTRVCRSALSRFPDSELHAEIEESVRGGDVYIVQPTGPPVDRHLMELLFLADACRRAGAARLTGVVPYFGYARQDRRANGREAVGGRLVADLLAVVAFERIVAVDLHTVSLEGFFSMPPEHLSATSLLANAIDELVTDRSVIVSPDLGAVKLAERYAGLLRRPLAVAHKIRLSGEEVTVHGIVGEVAGRRPIIIDDMISTGGTIEAAARALIAAGCVPEITVVATHALLVGPAIERLSALPLKRMVVSDSLPTPAHGLLPLQVVSLAAMLAETITRLNIGESMTELLSHR